MSIFHDQTVRLDNLLNATRITCLMKIERLKCFTHLRLQYRNRMIHLTHLLIIIIVTIQDKGSKII